MRGAQHLHARTLGGPIGFTHGTLERLSGHTTRTILYKPQHPLEEMLPVTFLLFFTVAHPRQFSL